MRVEKNQINPSLEVLKQKRRQTKLILIAVIILIVFIIFPLIFIGLSGLFHLPVISSLFGTAKAKDLGIINSESAVQNLLAKVPLKMNGEPGDFCLLCARKFEGQISVDTQITSEEVTTFINKYIGEDETIENLQVRMMKGGLEVSANLKKPIKIPVYVKVAVSLADTNRVSLKIEQAKVGFLPIPGGYREKAQKWFEQTVNKRITEINGFSLEKLDYHEGYGDFKGILPAEVTPSQGQWLKL